MGIYIGTFIFFILIFGLGFGVPGVIIYLYIRAIKQKKQDYQFKKNYYNTNLAQQQEIIRLQQIQIEEMKKQVNQKENKE